MRRRAVLAQVHRTRLLPAIECTVLANVLQRCTGLATGVVACLPAGGCGHSASSEIAVTGVVCRVVKRETSSAGVAQSSTPYFANDINISTIG